MTDTLYECLICGKRVEDYDPEFCCNGRDCCCAGGPVNPCVCSDECEDAVYKYIGLEYEDRRLKAGIEKYDNSEFLIQSFSP